MMPNNAKKGVSTKIKRVFKTTASVLLMMIMIFVMVIGQTSIEAYGITETEAASGAWSIIIGDEEIVYVESKEAGKQVIEGLKDYYLTKNADVIRVSFDPAIKVAYVQTPSAEVEKKSVKAAIQYLRTGDYVDVKTVEKITSKEKINFKTVYRKTSSLKIGTTKVKTKGVKGQKQVVSEVTKVNGKEISSRVISSKRLKKATNKVVLKGTANVTAEAGKTFDFKDGSDVVEYAKKFVGNPYEYGGSSLTKGTDCSGFVYSVYKNLGVNLPRVNQESVGKKVSYKNVKKGDILFYDGHVAIYAGNGKAVHAVNERLGIKVTDVNYTGKVQKVRRIFE